MEDFIVSFEHLAFRTKGMTNDFFRECFISGIKDAIRAHIIMALPQIWLEANKCAKDEKQVILAQIQKPIFFLTINPPPFPLGWD
jgi:hypothetical protein